MSSVQRGGTSPGHVLLRSAPAQQREPGACQPSDCGLGTQGGVVTSSCWAPHFCLQACPLPFYGCLSSFHCLLFPGKSKWWPLSGTPLRDPLFPEGFFSGLFHQPLGRKTRNICSCSAGTQQREGVLWKPALRSPRADDGLMGIFAI